MKNDSKMAIGADDNAGAASRIPLYEDGKPAAWIEKLVALKLDYHFDDDPASICAGISGETLFSAQEVRELRSIMPKLYRDTNGDPCALLIKACDDRETAGLPDRNGVSFVKILEDITDTEGRIALRKDGYYRPISLYRGTVQVRDLFGNQQFVPDEKVESVAATIATITTMLDVGADVLSEQDRILLTKRADAERVDRFPRVAGHQCGWVIYLAGEADAQQGAIEAARSLGASDQLVELLVRGHDVGAFLINIDVDA